MKNVVIGVVPFCYGPTAIAVAIGRQLKQARLCALTAVAENPSLDLLAQEKSIFQGVVPRTDLPKAMEGLALVRRNRLSLSTPCYGCGNPCLPS